MARRPTTIEIISICIALASLSVAVYVLLRDDARDLGAPVRNAAGDATSNAGENSVHEPKSLEASVTDGPNGKIDDREVKDDDEPKTTGGDTGDSEHNAPKRKPLLPPKPGSLRTAAVVEEASEFDVPFRVMAGREITSGTTLQPGVERPAALLREPHAPETDATRTTVIGTVYRMDRNEKHPVSGAVVFDRTKDFRVISGDDGSFSIDCKYSKGADGGRRFWVGVLVPGHRLAGADRSYGNWYTNDELDANGELELAVYEVPAAKFNIRIEAPGCGDFTQFQIWGGLMPGASYVGWDEWWYFSGHPNTRGIFNFEAIRDNVVIIQGNGPGYRQVDFKRTSVSRMEYDIVLTFEAVPTSEIHGTIRDSRTGEPLRGARIQSDGTTALTITNLSGEYVIHVEEENVDLLIVHPFYASVDIPPFDYAIDVGETCDLIMHDLGSGRSEVHLSLRPLVAVTGKLGNGVELAADYDVVGLPSRYWASAGRWGVTVNAGIHVKGRKFASSFFPWGIERLYAFKKNRESFGKQELKLIWNRDDQTGEYAVTLVNP